MISVFNTELWPHHYYNGNYQN